MEDKQQALHTAETSHGTFKSYILGFILSIVLTLIAYILVDWKLLSHWTLTLVIGSLALAQAWIQLRFFLHLGEEPYPRWNFLAFIFMAFATLIIIAGTIWIINNLDSRVMPMTTMSMPTEG